MILWLFFLIIFYCFPANHIAVPMDYAKEDLNKKITYNYFAYDLSSYELRYFSIKIDDGAEYGPLIPSDKMKECLLLSPYLRNNQNKTSSDEAAEKFFNTQLYIDGTNWDSFVNFLMETKIKDFELKCEPFCLIQGFAIRCQLYNSLICPLKPFAAPIVFVFKKKSVANFRLLMATLIDHFEYAHEDLNHQLIIRPAHDIASYEDLSVKKIDEYRQYLQSLYDNVSDDNFKKAIEAFNQFTQTGQMTELQMKEKTTKGFFFKEI